MPRLPAPVDQTVCKLLDPLEDRRLMSRFTHDHDPLLSPPAHVLAEVDAAWERAQDLIAGELELHFARSAMDRRVTGELRQPGGDTVECLSAGEALALACGDVALVLAA